MIRDGPIQDGLRKAGEHLRAGEHAEAARVCRILLNAHPDQPQALGLLGVLEGIAGHPQTAKDYLLRANELRPGDPNLINNLALACLKTGDLADAEKRLRDCLKRHPGFAPAWYTLAVVKRRQGDIHAAVAAYERVLSLDPEQAEAWANLAQLRERLNQLQLASEAVERSLSLDPSSPMARMAAAQIDGRMGQHDSARQRLEALLSDGHLGPTNEVIVRSRLADSLDALGQPSAAFAQYSAANRLQAESFDGDRETMQGPYSLDAIHRLARILDDLVETAATGRQDDPSGPFFLMGFPRSGTTLLDRMLSAHPEVISVEEQETLIDAHRDFVMTPSGAERLRSLSESQRRIYLEAYRRRLADATAETGRITLDKLPLHTIFLPLIARLFPGARVIFVVRDPRDVCLSCFTQRFELNAAMAHFLDLETTARYYRAVMDLGLDSIERLSIDTRQVRYEELVANPEPILRELIAFLGLPWDPAVLNYRSHIRGSRIDTPSYRQVYRPLYSSSIGRWRRYAKELDPIQALLAPAVSRLGYD